MGTDIWGAFNQARERKRQGSDAEAYQQYLQAQATQQAQAQALWSTPQMGPPNMVGPQQQAPGQSPVMSLSGGVEDPRMPQFSSQQWRGMGQQVALQQMLSQVPLNPLQKAQQQNYLANAQASRRPSPLPVSTQLHYDAIAQGFYPGTEDYARITKGYEAGLDIKAKQDERAATMSPGERVRQARTEAGYKQKAAKLDIALKRLAVAKGPLEISRLQKQVALDEKALMETKPTEAIAKMKYDYLKTLDPTSPKFARALGLEGLSDVPTSAFSLISRGIDEINSGQDPVDVFRIIFKTQPELIPYATQIKRTLIPSTMDNLFDAMMRTQTAAYKARTEK